MKKPPLSRWVSRASFYMMHYLWQWVEALSAGLLLDSSKRLSPLRRVFFKRQASHTQSYPVTSHAVQLRLHWQQKCVCLQQMQQPKKKTTHLGQWGACFSHLGYTVTLLGFSLFLLSFMSAGRIWVSRVSSSLTYRLYVWMFSPRDYFRTQPSVKPSASLLSAAKSGDRSPCWVIIAEAPKVKISSKSSIFFFIRKWKS